MADITVYVVAERCQVYFDDRYTNIEVFRTKDEAFARQQEIIDREGQADITEYTLGIDGKTTTTDLSFDQLSTSN
jgi:hypothetical protein